MGWAVPPSAPDDLQASVPASLASPALAAPPLGIRPMVDRFGRPAADGVEPVIAPQPGRLVAPLREGLEGLRLGRIGRAGHLALGPSMKRA